jgi:hypothetical protein
MTGHSQAANPGPIVTSWRSPAPSHVASGCRLETGCLAILLTRQTSLSLPGVVCRYFTLIAVNPG